MRFSLIAIWSIKMTLYKVIYILDDTYTSSLALRARFILFVE